MIVRVLGKATAGASATGCCGKFLAQRNTSFTGSPKVQRPVDGGSALRKAPPTYSYLPISTSLFPALPRNICLMKNKLKVLQRAVLGDYKTAPP